MAKWMRFVIDSGRVGDKRLIQQKTFAELVTPQIQAPMEEYPALQLAKPDFFSYGLGWFIQDYRGQQVWMHTGSINGLCAIIGIEPNKRLGVYVLENLDHAEIRHGLMYSVFDLFENGPRRDWSEDLKPIFARPRRGRGRNGGTDRRSDVGTVAPARALRRDVRRLGLWHRARHIREWRPAGRGRHRSRRAARAGALRGVPHEAERGHPPDDVDVRSRRKRRRERRARAQHPVRSRARAAMSSSLATLARS